MINFVLTKGMIKGMLMVLIALFIVFICIIVHHHFQSMLCHAFGHCLVADDAAQPCKRCNLVGTDRA